MTPQTPITISYPDGPPADRECTWQEFIEWNDDADLVADVAAQIAEYGYAQIGGGAAPAVWIFAGEVQ